MFHGSLVALVTPMLTDGRVDFNALANLVEWHIAEKTDAIVAVGTTGESATLSVKEHLAVVKSVIDVSRGRVPVIAGTGNNNTEATIDLTRNAMELGADACLLVTPYYNKPTQEGLFLHYTTVAHAVPVPIILYNVPGRTGVDMQPETVTRIANQVSNVIGIKEATGDLKRCTQILEGCQERIDIFSGDDASALELMKLGAKGVISVTANVAPGLMHDMCEAAIHGDFDKAEHINKKLALLHNVLFVESNPIPVKWALAEMEKIMPGIRLPLTPLSASCHQTVRNALRDADINI